MLHLQKGEATEADVMPKMPIVKERAASQPTNPELNLLRDTSVIAAPVSAQTAEVFYQSKTPAAPHTVCHDSLESENTHFMQALCISRINSKKTSILER